MFEPGAKFENYTLESYLGSGSFAQVWRARDEKNHEIAIKIYHESAKDDFQILMEREYEELSSLIHPNIITPTSFGYVNTSPYITCPLCDGNLNQLLNQRILELKKNKKNVENLFNELELASILCDISTGLDFLKTKKVVHHDIKPSNLLFKHKAGKFKAYISDFGASYFMKKTLAKGSHKEELNSEYVGYGLSLGYAAPEVYKGRPVFASDVFSLGISIYELATGDLPSKTSNLGLGYVLNHDGFVPELSGNYSDNFKNLIFKMMDRYPENRPTSIDIQNYCTTFINSGKWPEISKNTTKGEQVYKPYTQVKPLQPAYVSSNQATSSSYINKLKNSKSFIISVISLLTLVIVLWFLLNKNNKNSDDVLTEFLQKGKFNEYLNHLETDYKKYPKSKTLQLIGTVKTTLEKYNVTNYNKEGLAIIESNGLRGLINQDFNVILEPFWKDIKFNGTIIAVQNQDYHWGAFDMRGEQLLPAEFLNIKISEDRKSIEGTHYKTKKMSFKQIN